METIKNGLWEYTKYEGGSIRRDAPAHIIVFANEFPKVDKLSLDRWDIIEIDGNGDFERISALDI